MKKLLSMVLLLFLFSGVLAAVDSISFIKKLYRQATALEKEQHCRHEIVFNSMLPAVGLQTTTVRFVFQSGQKNSEVDPYLMEYDLKKVSASWNVAASAQYTHEYLYDSRGNLIFFYSKRDDGRGSEEKRYYFKNRKLIRLMATGKSERKSTRDIKEGRAAEKAGRKQYPGIQKKAASYLKAFQYLQKVEALK